MNIIKRSVSCFLVISTLLSLSANAFAETDITTGKPWLASNVQGAVTADTPANAKDDFYLYVNKDTILSYEILPGYSSTGLVMNRVIENEQDILALFTDYEPESSDAKLAADLYDLYLDWDSRNEQGVQPLKAVTDAVEAISSIDEMNTYYSTVPYELQAAKFFAFGMTADFNDSSVYKLGIYATPLLLKDSAEYVELTEVGAIKKENYEQLFTYLLMRLGYSEQEARKKIENCFALESMLAPAMLTSDEWKSPDIIGRVNNSVPMDEFEKLQGNVPILQMFDLCGFERKENLFLYEPEWLEAFKSIYDDAHLELLKDYIIVHTAVSFSKYLDRECFIETLECSNRITGTEGMRSDEQYASSFVKGTLPWSVSRMYCERYVTEEDKQNVTEMVYEILHAYSEMIMEEDFITEETKKKAVEKLENITINVLYPDDWSEYMYTGLEFAPSSEGGTLIGAITAVNRCAIRKAAEDFSKPVDKHKWGVYPTTVNAFYNPSTNSVNMLAAFCRGDIYNAGMSIEERYAKLGTVIAHEISHSFDGNGSRFDKDGNYADWWNEEERAAFDAKIEAIADYADTIYCWDGTHVNGKIITGEACADMGGVACMLHIARSIEGFDYEKFFTAHAQIWSFVCKYNDFIDRLTDEHPPEFFRVNATLQQFDEFYDCYGIEEGDGMYLAPEKRVAIW